MALFLVANNLTPDDMLDPERELAFPESVVEFFEGRLGQPPGGFPPALQERVLKGRPAADRAARRQPAAGRPRRGPREGRRRCSAGPPPIGDALSYVLYPRVFPDLAAHERTYSDTSILPTPLFFFGPEPGEEIQVEIEPGKTLIVKLLAVGEPHADGKRTVFFELNGQPREVEVARPLAGLGGPRDPQGRPRRPRPDRRPAARPGRRRGRLARRPGPQGPEAALDRGHEDGDHHLRRAPGRVADVLATVGLQVKAGDLLLRLTSESHE